MPSVQAAGCRPNRQTGSLPHFQKRVLELQEGSVRAWFQLGDRGHNLVGGLLIDFLEPLFGAGCCFGSQGGKIHRLAVFDGDAAGPWKFKMPAVGFIGPKNPARNHWRARFDYCKANAGASRLELAIASASALRK